MNAFYEHHKNNIRFHYRCFDRILLNGTIQPFQQEQRVVGFFTEYRNLYPVSRDVLRDIATQFHNWAKNRLRNGTYRFWNHRTVGATSSSSRISSAQKPMMSSASSRPVNRHGF